jgi:hypothetical protein
MLGADCTFQRFRQKCAWLPGLTALPNLVGLTKT